MSQKIKIDMKDIKERGRIWNWGEKNKKSTDIGVGPL